MAAKTKPIKTDLFKFVTLRTPQLINEQKKDVGFIFHKKEISDQSKFLQEAITVKELKTAREIVNAAVKEFVPLTKMMEVKAINKDMYNFSSWLMNNRNVIIKEEAKEKINVIAKLTLTKEEENLLWDNLYYQVLTRKSSYVRQACIQMLIAHNFITKIDNYDSKKIDTLEEEYLNTLAKAKVVIDKSFTKEEKKRLKNKIVSQSALKKLKKDTKKHYYKKNIETYQFALNEITNLEYKYTKAYTKALKEADENHKNEVEVLIKEAKLEAQSLQEEENVTAAKTSVTPKIIPLDVELPKFEFEFESHFSKANKTELSNATKNILVAHNITEEVSIEEAKLSLQDRISYYTNKLGALIKTKTKNVFINGVKVPKGTSTLNPYCYIAKIVKSATIDPVEEGDTDNDAGLGNLTDPFIEDLDINNSHSSNNANYPTLQRIRRINNLIYKINLGSANAAVTSQTHTLTVNHPTANTYAITETQVELIGLNNGELTINLFPNHNLLFLIGSTLNLTGQFTLSDGTILNYNVNIDLNIKIATGCINVGSGGNDDDSDDGNTGTSGSDQNPADVDVNLYGIGKIGVADFRKVEQEVCCYVAGEVSHIENVLAREFKKRETRSLLSSESTTETTSETEVENLTDTTTTERNELQSEVSKVLNEDKSENYGVNAEVHGGNSMFGFSVSGHADFANSSSSSQSNTQAQTYAQEITERALERVVSKTSKKQTSRILKEFEEVNQHGFDNRKGTEHVSGVYRWIDIIYKNQLVNYGKRLMYEFMVPEPARFFKEAINIKGSGNVDFIEVDEPIHPSKIEDYSISNATELNENNYLQLASAYGVEIKTRPSNTIYIGSSFSYKTPETQGPEWDETASGNENIRIPKGYITKKGKVRHKFSSEAPWGAHDQALLGSKDMNLSLNSIYYVAIDTFKESIPFSYSNLGHHTGNITVSIECELTLEGEKQWQNETYKAILDGYYEQVEKYNNYLAIKGITGNNEKITFSNSFNRILEKREIQRICIEMLATPYGNPIGQDNYVVKDNEADVVNQNANFENHAAHVKFFEQAFDWDIMAYKFYNYFWANKDKWVSLFQETSNADPIFQAFLQSGMARVIVPVRPGFEDAVTYYIETGDIWNGGDLVIDQENDLYISIADEMQSTEGAVEKEWETRMPTALTMIQKDTVGLQETGLPCCNDGGLKSEEKPIQGLQALIGGDQPIEEIITPK